MTRHIDSFSQFHFRGQHDDEKIVSVIHRHWFDITMHYIFIGFVVALLISATLLVDTIESMFGMKDVLPLLLFIDSIVVTFLWFYGFLMWIDYWLDVWIVTDQRVVNIEQKGLFSRHVSELHFHTVQDVTSKVQGLIPTLLNYGDVEVQTAAEKTRFLFRRVPDPYAIKAMLVERQRSAHLESIGKK